MKNKTYINISILTIQQKIAIINTVVIRININKNMTDPTVRAENRLQNNEVSVEARQQLLTQFCERPDDESIWQTAYSWVTVESVVGNQQEPVADIPAEELVAFADLVRKTPLPERYELTTKTASNERMWFDILGTFDSPQLEQAKEGIIESWIDRGDNPTKFEKGLDLGTGTGKSLRALEVGAEKVVGLDRSIELLAIAKTRAARGTELVLGEVDKLPFADNEFDIATSSGLTGSLDRSTLRGFYAELSRVLRPGGIYVEVSSWPFDGYIDEQDAKIVASSKAMLADMIVDTVSGKHQLKDHMNPEEQEALLESLGLDTRHYDVSSEDGKARNLLTIITRRMQSPVG